MPTASDFIVLVIGILAILAFALLLAPAVVWARRQLSPREPVGREIRADAVLDPRAVANQLSPSAGVFDEDDPGAPPPGPVAPDPSIEDRVIRIVSWAFLMAV